MCADRQSTELKRTPLFDEHAALGAKFVPFAGYEMPVQYPLGVLKEHLWTREKAGLFDVSHMGQAIIAAEDGQHDTVAIALERLVPADLLNLQPGRQRYSQLLAPDGGILDDLMITRPVEQDQVGNLVIVVNAACKESDFSHIATNLPAGVRLEVRPDNALLALQGPAATDVLAPIIPAAVNLKFMDACQISFAGTEVFVSRTGYTGEDGFEISVPASRVRELWRALLASPDVAAIGLGARDSLRLEAGLCLYGHDIDTTTSPVEADLTWSIQKRRRAEGGFPGAARIQKELKDGPARRRVGIKPEGRAPAREGTEILSATGERIGHITSGGFGPSANAPVAMGYVAAEHATPGTPVQLVVRGKSLAASVVTLPFVAHRYKR